MVLSNLNVILVLSHNLLLKGFQNLTNIFLELTAQSIPTVIFVKLLFDKIH